ncbi:MAG: hypothetical protein ABEJ65_07350 [bacterium]
MTEKRTTAGKLLVVMFFGLMVLGYGTYQPVKAVDPRSPEFRSRVRNAFFSTLEPSRKLKYLKYIEAQKQLTSAELGTRYRWGWIPADREPPLRLANWWEELSPRRKRKKRLKWFNKRYDTFDPRRAARYLEQEERLNEVVRQLKQGKDYKGLQFESVDFPQPVKKSDDSTDERQTERTGQPSQQSDQNTGSSKQSEQKSQTEQTKKTEESSEKQAEEEKKEKSTEKNITETIERKTQPDTQSKPAKADTRVLEMDRGTVIFESTPDGVRVIDSSRGSSSSRLNQAPSETFDMPSPGLRAKDFPPPNLYFPSHKSRDKTAPPLRFRQSP